MQAPLLELRDVGFAYPGQPAIARGWCRSIGAGIVLLHGDTGSGKSTLLRVLAGELSASGTLVLRGVRQDLDPEGYRRHVFWCDTTNETLDPLTVRACTARIIAGDPDFDEAAWDALADGFGLAPHIDKALYMLSTGSRRKVGLAAALASGRALVLLDEPAAALDGASTRCLWNALEALGRRTDRAVVVASSSASIAPIAPTATITLPL